MSFGENLKNSRQKEGFSQEYLAKKLNISSATLSRYETGDREPDLEQLKSICKLLKVSSDFLLDLIS